ncbi:hypothetical protein OG984_09275 [Nocardioides sp. NBC_00368]|uniref:hypothetical protein n=1 Tax=Nocardioides sp. NBC_00368 TaxID=2976000 RepID=UPI002E1D079C
MRTKDGLRTLLLQQSDLPGEWRQVRTTTPAVDGSAGHVGPAACAHAGERLERARTRWTGSGVVEVSVAYASDAADLKEEIVSAPGANPAGLMGALDAMVDACRHFTVTAPGKQTFTGERSPADFGQGDGGFGMVESLGDQHLAYVYLVDDDTVAVLVLRAHAQLASDPDIARIVAAARDRLVG